MSVVVVALVSAQLCWFASTRPASGLDRRERGDHRLRQGAVVGVRAGNIDTSGIPFASDRTWIFDPFLPGWDRSEIPLFTRTLAASRIAADQSSSPATPRWSRTARCSFSKIPALAHAANRQCAVGTVTPNEGGRCRRAHALIRTKTTAVKTARLSTGMLPPPCGRGLNREIRGSAISHNASGTSRKDNASTTMVHCVAQKIPSIRDMHSTVRGGRTASSSRTRSSTTSRSALSRQRRHSSLDYRTPIEHEFSLRRTSSPPETHHPEWKPSSRAGHICHPIVQQSLQTEITATRTDTGGRSDPTSSVGTGTLFVLSFNIEDMRA